LQRAAKLLPQDYLVQSQLGYCLLTTGQTNAAIGYLQKGATLNSSYGPVWEHIGAAYLPSSRIAWQHLAQAYQATGRNSDARRAAARAQQLGGAAPNVAKKKA